MVDPDRLRRLLGMLRETTTMLDGETDAIRRRHLVQTTAQICIDLAAHVIASEGYRVPATYADSFTVLREESVIDEQVAARLRGLAGMRNLIVHLYAEVDDDRVAAEVVAGLDDVDAFAATMARLVDPGP